MIERKRRVPTSQRSSEATEIKKRKTKEMWSGPAIEGGLVLRDRRESWASMLARHKPEKTLIA